VKVLHLPYTFYPDAAGGTEVYVDALARAQRAGGLDAFVAAPAQQEAHYEHAGLPVWRFPIDAAVRDIRELYGDGDAIAAEGFIRILEAAQPDLVHMHAFTAAASLRAVRAAKECGIPVIFSYHTPTVSCQRGTLLRWGSEVCDGALDVRRCAQCALHAAGLNQFASRLVGSLPPAAGGFLGNMGFTGGAWTALRMTELIELRHAAFRSLMAEADHVIALCECVKQVLLRNSVPAEKISLCRQGLVQEVLDDAPPSREQDREGDRLRIVFLGRLDPTKGVHVLLEALHSVPDLDVHLDIFGVRQDASGAAYLAQLKNVAGHDARIRFLAPIPAREVIPAIREYDILAVPSQSLETGPLVVLEAFAAGVPVMGSDLGGIAELVRHDVDGLLVEPRSVSAWAAAIRGLATESAGLTRLRSNIRRPRRIAEAAQEIDRLYRRFVPAHAYA